MYILTSKRDINTLDSINNNEFYAIEYGAATGLAFNLVDLGKQNILNGTINFSYMCDYQKKGIDYQKIIEKGLSSKNRSLYSNKNENNESLYFLLDKEIKKGLQVLKSCSTIGI